MLTDQHSKSFLGMLHLSQHFSCFALSSALRIIIPSESLELACFPENV